MPGWFDDFIGGLAAAAVIGLIALAWRGNREYWMTFKLLLAGLVIAAAIVGAFLLGLSIKADAGMIAGVAELLRWIGLGVMAVFFSGMVASLSAYRRLGADRPAHRPGDRVPPPDRPK